MRTQTRRALAIFSTRSFTHVTHRQLRRNTRDTLMTSTMSRRRHNYISLLDIPCRINCIVSACPLYDSRVSVAPSVALGDVAIRSATPRKSGLGSAFNPFGSADAPRGIVPTLYGPPLSTTSLISSSSPRRFNYQQSVFSHVLQSPGVQLAEDFREAFSTGYG